MSSTLVSKNALFVRGNYQKPTIHQRTSKTAYEVTQELRRHKNDLFQKRVGTWNKGDKEAFVRVMNTCSCVLFTSNSASASIVPSSTNGHSGIEQPELENGGPLLGLMKSFENWCSGGSAAALEMKKWLDHYYVFVDFSTTNPSLSNPGFNNIPQHAAIAFVQVGISNSVFLVQSLDEGYFVLGQLTSRYPGLVGTVIRTDQPITMF